MNEREDESSFNDEKAKARMENLHDTSEAIFVQSNQQFSAVNGNSYFNFVFIYILLKLCRTAEAINHMNTKQVINNSDSLKPRV